MHALKEQTPPPNPANGGASIELRFSSVRELVPGICQAGTAFAAGPNGGELPRFTLVLRELLTNAIEHGNGGDPAREVTCRVRRVDDHTVELSVTDEGPGFTPKAVDLSPLDVPTDIARGGLRLVNALANSLRFEEDGRRAVCRVSRQSTENIQSNSPAAGNSGKEW